MNKNADWLRAALDGDREGMRSLFPWADLMASCPQDSLYHAEGDVWTHTMMVMDGAERRGSGLPDDAMGVMRLSALFHDSAKHDVTSIEWCPKENRERVKQPGHAAKGGDRAWRALIDAGFPVRAAREVVGLCQWHQRPSHIPEQSNQQGRIARFVAEGGRWDRLLALCEADQEGRISPNVEDGLISLGVLRLDIEALSDNIGHDLLSGEAPDSAEWRVRMGLSFDADPFYSPPQRDLPLLTVMSGLPGSGKSTIARSLAEDGAEMISLDSIRREMRGYKRNQEFEGRCYQEAASRLKRALAAGRSVVWDACCLDQRTRSKVLSVGRAYGALTRVMSIDVPAADAFARNSERDEPVPQSIMMMMAEKREMTLATEAHSVISVINGDMTDVSLRSRDDGDEPTPLA